MKMSSVKREFSKTLNCYGIDSDLETPDYMLAEYLVRCLEAYSTCVGDRKARDLQMCKDSCPPPAGPEDFKPHPLSSKYNRQ